MTDVPSPRGRPLSEDSGRGGPDAHSAHWPHPTGVGVVGRYVHTYDSASLSPYQNHIPGMRPSREASAHRGPAMFHPPGSGTPIYDALYAEYRRSFRALPGDRTGEEDLAFTPFGTGQGHGGWERSGVWEGPGNTDTGRRTQLGHLPALPPGRRDGRQHGM